MDIASIGLPRALLHVLQANGLRTVDELCKRNVRELLDLPRVGKGALASIEAALDEHGRQLAVDPWAAYVCARHQRPTDDSSLTGLFLCRRCQAEYGDVLGEPEFTSGETYRGFCAHCNHGSTLIRLVQWYFCGNCERKVRSLGRGIAAHQHFAMMWEEVVAPQLPDVDLIEVDETRIRLAHEMTDNSTEDFAAVINGVLLAAFELKGGRGHMLKAGVGPRVTNFQLDTTDCDGISRIAEGCGRPTYLVNVQVVNRYSPPTVRHSGLEVVFADLWSLADAWRYTQPRPRERKDAAYFDTTMFRPLSDFADHIHSAEFAAAERRLRDEGPPALYRPAPR